MSRDPITMAVRRMIEDTETLAEFAEAAIPVMGWRFSNPKREAPARIRQMLNGQAGRHLPARLIPVAIRVTGLDYVTPLLQREAIRAEDARAAAEMPEKPGVRSVRRDWRERGVA